MAGASGELDREVAALVGKARHAARALATIDRATKDAALVAIAGALRSGEGAILEGNARDVAAARANGTSAAMIDRLTLDAKRIEAIAKSVEEIAALADPVGEVIATSTRPSGIRVSRVRVPIGVIAMIYEARPNVTIEASALAIKAGNAIVLRGGSEARASNAALLAVLGSALEAEGLPRDAAVMIPTTDRDAVRALVQCRGVDLAIPRGGESLIEFVTDVARVPVVQHYKGVCHLFLDAGCDAGDAARIAVDAKLSRPGVCNALECLLVDASDAARVLPIVASALRGPRGDACELRGDARARAIVPMNEAHEEDWGHEFLAPILAVKIVDGIDGAIAHVARYGSGHTEAIVTKSDAHAARWRREIDAACVVVNASTRFHDGGELGLGAEIGIATSRLHWRGPMGLESLTTMKWIVDGEGQTRHRV